MKTILSILLFIACFINASAQGIASIHDDMLSTLTATQIENKSESTPMIQLSNKVIKHQIHSYLSNTLEYPEVLRDYRLKGGLVLEVRFTENGQIQSYTITKATHEVFEKVVKKSISNFESLHLNKNEYCGASIVKIPINFSI